MEPEGHFGRMVTLSPKATPRSRLDGPDPDVRNRGVVALKVAAHPTRPARSRTPSSTVRRRPGRTTMNVTIRQGRQTYASLEPAAMSRKAVANANPSESRPVLLPRHMRTEGPPAFLLRDDRGVPDHHARRSSHSPFMPRGHAAKRKLKSKNFVIMNFYF